MHMVLKGIIRKGWYRKKKRSKRTGGIRVDVGGRRKGRATMIGIIGDGGLHYFEFCDSGNIENVEKFLMRAYKKFGKLLIFTDNASYHSEKMFDRLYEQTNGGIIAEFLPEYTPELASIESQWREIKRFIANLFFVDIEEMKDAVMDGLSRGLIKIVKVHDYLIV